MAFPLFLLLSLALSAVASALEPPAGFTALFNGRDLAGWRGGSTFDHRQLLAMPEQARQAQLAQWTATLTALNEKTGQPHWRVEREELVNDGFGDYAATERDYGDFELRVEYQTVAAADSGVYLRGVPQVQIWDATHGDPRGLGQDKGSGGLWNNQPGAPGKDPLVKADKPFSEWNHLRIIMVGSRVSVWLNDQRVVEHAILENYYDQKLSAERRLPVPPRGPIELQTHGGEIRWRHIFLREIGSVEANGILASHGGTGFEPIFNGRDLSGWAGALEAVKVENGVIAWQAGKGGTPYYDRELTDFAARLEFKVPPGGNNGLAIRYPGTGDPAYAGMCELQVLDDHYEQLKGSIDPRQAHGSAYGMVAAARGYQHPVGEWNFQEVTVRGSTLRVELNGTVILDADLAKVDPATVLAQSPHPGKDRASGFFGFAGHSDPVEFRAVQIKPLP